MTAGDGLQSSATDPGERLFTFAVIADTHVNQHEDRASSDFAVNRLANARNRHVLQEIRHTRPAFVLHLGDIVHPTPIHPGYAPAAAAFRALARELGCPLYLTPGNHDVGDKPGDWLPVPSVNEAYLAMYRAEFGPNFHAFETQGCRFVMIDAQIINSGLACEQTQRRWLEAELARVPRRRTFVCTHYPPFLHDPDEPGHYDNLDEPGRSWLLGLCERHGVEALFAGHVHNFGYHEHHGTRMYLLPSTAFVRLDYSELFRIPPEPDAESGRNDTGKLGYLLVDVHRHGHVAHAIRTFGATRGPASDASAGALPVTDASAAAVAAPERIGPVRTRAGGRAPLGLDLRQPWCETVEIAPSGALDEFDRKRARNDWPLLALWEMGIARLRVPAGDLARPATRARMQTLWRAGHRFSVAVHGLDAALIRLLRAPDAPIDSVEVIAAPAGFAALRPGLAALAAEGETRRPRVLLSPLRRHDSAHHHGDRARHVIQHGFAVDEAAEVTGRLEAAGLQGLVDGVVFRVERDEALAAVLPALAAFSAASGLAVEVYLRLAAASPSVAQDDDQANALRVAEAAVGAFLHPSVRVTLDTFGDVDRGYFPRTGLVDRRGNPRAAGHVLRTLTAELGAAQGPLRANGVFEATGAARLIAVAGRTGNWLLALPAPPRPAPASLTVLPLPAGTRAGMRVRVIDLVTGTVDVVPGTADGHRWKPDVPIDCGRLRLIAFGADRDPDPDPDPDLDSDLDSDSDSDPRAGSEPRR